MQSKCSVNLLILLNKRIYICSMKNLAKIYLVTALITLSCANEKKINESQLTSFVNPFVGTGGHGHTFPGASMPFGMMQLSPDTRLDGWDGC